MTGHMSTNSPSMTPPVGVVGPMDRTTSPVPGWVAVVSIMLGILGLLCWGQQGVSTLLADMSALKDAGLDFSPGHQSAALAGYLVNIALAILLLVGGLKAKSGNQHAAAALLRGWSWLKLLSVAGGLVVAWVFLDELVIMNRIGLEQAIAEVASEADAAESSGATDAQVAFSASLLERLTIGLVVLSAAMQAAWPCVVLAIVPSKVQVEQASGVRQGDPGLPERGI